MNTDTSNLCNTYSVVRPMVRDNSSPQQIKKRGFYMVDSSYLIPSNPNSMRDSGPLRNAQYVVVDPVEQDYLRKSNQDFRKTTGSFSQIPVQPRDLERMHETLNSRCIHPRPLSSYGSLGMAKTSSTGFYSSSYSQTKQQSPNIINKVTVVRVNDYTKNISGSIFTPNLTHSTKYDSPVKSQKVSSYQK